ncbi:MAG: DUF1232 domain-containing protein [Anaerolineae bacterium]|nr:DUF1232 domain-containing protein [Anaerolineae bacterium]
MAAFHRWRQRAQELRAETYAIYLACRDPGVPWYARGLAAAIVAYALSPIDLIPDPIPVLGQVDDLVLVPLGIALLLRLIPGSVMAECRERARAELVGGVPSRGRATAAVVAIWLAAAALIAGLIWRALGG